MLNQLLTISVKSIPETNNLTNQYLVKHNIMRIELNMPQMGESIAEGTILKWRKGVGERVERDEEILEISTDKVDTEIPSPAAGIIAEILVPEGKTVPVKTLLAIIETEADKTSTQDKTDKAAVKERPSPRDSSPHDGSDAGGLQVKEFRRQTKEAPAPEPTTTGKSSFLSPLVQNIAAEAGVGLDEVQRIPGTGRDGRVTKQDILNYIEQRKAQPIAKAAPPKQPAPTAASPTPPAPAPTLSPEPAPSVWRGAEDQIVEMDRLRRVIADHMVKSVHTSPHVTSFSEVDLNRIVEHRERNKNEFVRRDGVNLTYTAYFIYLTARALKEFPYINASVDGYNIILRKQINIGFAVELPNFGLIVPVIKGADALSLTGIARTINSLAEKARNNRLSPEDISGGTFTITNVGIFGNIGGSPIINQPQVAILGTGTVRKVPAVIETPSGDAIAIRWRMMLSMSYDHRIIDGAMAGRFMTKIKNEMENFNE